MPSGPSSAFPMEFCGQVARLARESSGGGAYGAVAAAHSRALATISHEIAEAIRSFAPPQR